MAKKISAKQQKVYGARRVAMVMEGGNEKKLAYAQEISNELGRELGVVYADPVRIEFERRYGTGLWGKWAGALFKKNPNFYPTGDFVPSNIEGYNANVRRTWRYTGV